MSISVDFRDDAVTTQLHYAAMVRRYGRFE